MSPPQELAFSPQLIAAYRSYRDFDLVVDSRRVVHPDRTVFFALPGRRRDGHDFIPTLIEAGVTDFVVRTVPSRVDNHESIRFTVVESPLHYLQQLAAYHRRQFDRLNVIAITGSNGKTVVKDYLTALLATTFSVCSTPRSYNSQIGVALSVWQLRDHHRMAVFEAGISEPGEMNRLEFIIRPTIGVFTVLGTAHLAAFDSVRHLAQEKLQLFTGADRICFPSDQQLVHRLCSETVPRADLIPINVERAEKENALPEALKNVYRYNALLAIAIARTLGVGERSIQQTVSTFQPLRNRLERREGRDGGVIINDSYSNDLDGLIAALEFTESQDPYRRIRLILGRVQAVPDLSDRLHSLLAGRVDQLISVDFDDALSEWGLDVARFSSVEVLLSKISTIDTDGYTTLIKGPSYHRFDRIADALSRRIHRTTLRIDLTALRRNFNLYRSLLPADCKLLVMAKASAYGSGALPVARMLQDAGADYLAVAYPEEGRALREGGIELRILVLNAEPYSFALLKDYRLEPAIHDVEQFRQAVAYDLSVHLEVDTGMARLGFSTSEFIEHLHELRHPAVTSVFSHLATSDDRRHDAFTEAQILRFRTLLERYRAGGGTQVLAHLLNSNGISRFPAANFDMARLGIGLYGLADDSLKDRLQPAISLTATVSAVNDYAAGTPVGYGCTSVLGRPARLAVVSLGYADGLPRAAGRGRYALSIDGRMAPTVGQICMDMCMVDVTDIEGVVIGSEVVVFGPDRPVGQLAEVADTVVYEILTGIGSRVHRIYSGE